MYSSIHLYIMTAWSICLSIGQSAAFRHQYGWSYWLYLEADEYYGWVTSAWYAPLHSILHLQHPNINDMTGESIRLDVVTSSRDELNEVRSIVRALSEGNKVMRSLTLYLLYYTIFHNYHHLYLYTHHHHHHTHHHHHHHHDYQHYHVIIINNTIIIIIIINTIIIIITTIIIIIVILTVHIISM